MEGYYLFAYLCSQLNNMGKIKEAHMHENGFIRIRAVMDEGPVIFVEGDQNDRVQS